mgnify:CR=1 FL=1
MREFTSAGLEAATLAGATYADVRVTDTETQSISVRNGVVEGIESSASFGFGVRAMLWTAAVFALMAFLSTLTLTLRFRDRLAA